MEIPWTHEDCQPQYLSRLVQGLQRSGTSHALTEHLILTPDVWGLLNLVPPMLWSSVGKPQAGNNSRALICSFHAPAGDMIAPDMHISIIATQCLLRSDWSPNCSKRKVIAAPCYLLRFFKCVNVPNAQELHTYIPLNPQGSAWFS